MQVTFESFVPGNSSLTVKTGRGWGSLSLCIPKDYFFVDTGEKDKFLFDIDQENVEALLDMLKEALQYMEREEE